MSGSCDGLLLPIIAEDFAAVRRAGGAPGCPAQFGGDEAHAAVADAEVHTAGVARLRRARLAILRAGLNLEIDRLIKVKTGRADAVARVSPSVGLAVA